jgi:RNA polymerase sigma factor (sigma-70 family)
MLGAAIQLIRLDLLSDADLLTRFLEHQDEAAFETLLLRHTPAVRAACSGWLRSPSDIDDAAQATFLVLVQRAGSIRDRAALGGWLYRVAANVARRLRLQGQRNRSCPSPEEIPGPDREGDTDLHELLTEEVARLPDKYRIPVQLCYLVGLTTTEAAQRLGWPKGTVLTRLAWARERLHHRLVRRGVAPTLLAGLWVAVKPPPINGQWVRVTALAAKGMLAGESPTRIGVSEQTISVTKGVVRAMITNRLKSIVLAALLVVGLAGFGVHHWASASNGPESPKASNDQADSRLLFQKAIPSKDRDSRNPQTAPTGRQVDEALPAAPGRRREAVIRLPMGTFAKEVDASPYGSGCLTWTYEEERVLGLIEASVMGVEVELATEAEYSLSSTGVIYGVITSVRLNHLKLPDGEQFAQLKPFVGLWSAVEPLFNEVMIDLPFSYHFRVQGDRLIITNFRMLLAGPNPLGKLGGLAGNGNGNDAFAVLAAFQALGTAIEGTYLTPDAKDKPTFNKRPGIFRNRTPVDPKKGK